MVSTAQPTPPQPTQPEFGRPRLWLWADPRLLVPPDLKAEHLHVHRLLYLDPPAEGRDLLLFRHELLRVAANARSGHKHNTSTTATQRAHSTPVPLIPLRDMEDKYHRALLIYERWVYIRRQRDVETIDLLFHALMKRMGNPLQSYLDDHHHFHPTPWDLAGCSPGRYLAIYRNITNHNPRT